MVRRLKLQEKVAEVVGATVVPSSGEDVILSGRNVSHSGPDVNQ